MHDIEHAAFSAWPAMEEQDYDGWRLRFANGYTKRANSANAIATAADLTPAQIDHIEGFYRLRGLPAVFRLASFCTGDAADQALALRGYRMADPSLVMSRRLAADVAGSESDGRNALRGASGTAGYGEFVLLNDAESWLDAFQAVSGVRGLGQKTHLQMLHAIRGNCAFAVLRVQDEIVCCGLGVMDGEYLGLFDIATSPAFRGRDFATRLCHGITQWGAQQGASVTYLQVLRNNTAAIRLYEKLGYQASYSYWYRLQP
jgi:ribosomal protein S18 acetylase RimI-like enzyme